MPLQIQKKESNLWELYTKSLYKILILYKCVWLQTILPEIKIFVNCHPFLLLFKSVFPLFSGRSLIWVAILGLVVFYLYGIISFALMRSMFDPDEYLYCASLWECTITVIRYGLIGDMFEVYNYLTCLMHMKG